MFYFYTGIATEEMEFLRIFRLENTALDNPSLPLRRNIRPAIPLQPVRGIVGDVLLSLIRTGITE